MAACTAFAAILRDASRLRDAPNRKPLPLRVREALTAHHKQPSSPGLTGRPSTPRLLDSSQISLEYWIARPSRATTAVGGAPSRVLSMNSMFMERVLDAASDPTKKGRPSFRSDGSGGPWREEPSTSSAATYSRQDLIMLDRLWLKGCDPFNTAAIIRFRSPKHLW